MRDVSTQAFRVFVVSSRPRSSHGLGTRNGDVGAAGAPYKFIVNYLFLNVRALLAGMATSLGFVAGVLLVSGRVCRRIGAGLAEAAALCGKDE